jgi:hypothetical protein
MASAGASPPGAGAGIAEDTDNSDGSGYRAGTDGGDGDDFGPGPEPVERDAAVSAVGTRVRPDTPDGAEATGPTPSARGIGIDGSRGRAEDGTALPEGNRADSEDGGDTGGRDADQDAGQAAGSQDAGRARQPGRGSEDAGKASAPGKETETAEPTAHSADTAQGQTTEASSADAPEPEQADQPEQQPLSPDASPDQPGETETIPDQDADKQRLAILEQRIEAMQQKIDEMEAKLATGQPEQQPAPDHSPGSGEEPAPSGMPDATKQGEHRDVPSADGDPSDAADPADKADIEGLASDKSGIQGHRTQEKTDRHVFTAENVTAMGTGIAFGQSVAEIFHNLPPEVGAGVTGVALLGAVMATKIRDVFHKIRRKG